MADAITACDGYTSVHLAEIKSSYHLYTDEDLHKKLIYAEASRGCPYGCEFCLSSHSGTVREFPLEPFLAEMEILVSRGVKTIKFLDRTFNLNIKRAQRIMEFFLEKILQRQSTAAPLVVHFEMIPSRFPAELLETISRFPPGTLRLEIGIQTLNPGVAAIIGRPSDTELELASLRFLAKNTNAVIHADLIAGLPGEGIDSFGKGFDLLREALLPPPAGSTFNSRAEIQPGILKLLPGAPIARHSVEHKMRYSSSPPYEILETAAMPAADLNRIKNFARFWELIVNRNLFVLNTNLSTGSVFKRFLNLSDFLLLHFGQNWGIAKKDLMDAVLDWNDRAYL
ncbi:MAG: radical SAM protein [Treponema sp.]|nr:radical SAM protein [Treponema sp.]